MDDRQRQRELKDERYQDWQTRRRSPGDIVTWAVVLGGVLAVLLLFCAAYDENSLLGVGVGVLILAWVLIVWVLGGVNVLAVMWGRSVNPEHLPEQERVVFAASAALALIAIALPVIDTLSSVDFGLYGLVAGVVGVVFFIVLWRGSILRRP
jgi:hypothetical protein